jgi:hypothetical protein
VALFLTKRKEKSMTDKEKIEKGEYVDCWLCKDVFARIQQTGRYCSKCGRGFCEGQHGSFSHGTGRCIICGAKKIDKQ